MGFSVDAVRHALQVNNQDEEAALNSLLSGNVDSGAASAAPAPVPPPVPPKKSGMFGNWGKK